VTKPARFGKKAANEAANESVSRAM
jgi:hypothetical protein